MDEGMKNRVAAWFAKGDEDLFVAKHLAGHGTFVAVGAICFHCQQCVEKYLKGLLVLRDLDFRKSHDLVYLLRLTGEIQLVERFYRGAAILDDYAIDPRYPGDYADMPISKAFEAIETAEAIKQAVLDLYQDQLPKT